MIHAIKRRLIEACKAEYRRTKRDTTPAVVALGIPIDDDMAKAQFAQNVIRVAMEATYEEMMPFGHHAVLQMAVRSASYALSIAPLEDQDHLVSLFMQNFAEAHQLRTAQGTVIKSAWDTDDGSVRANYD